VRGRLDSSKVRILIVDDDPVARLTLPRILLDAASDVVEAEDGDHAWSLLQQGLRPAVCCSDVSMPRLDGIGLLQRAAADACLDDLPFVLVSSAAEQSTIQAAVAAGAQGYVLKPFLAAQTVGAVTLAAQKLRAARAEHFLVTRRRLGLGLAELEAQLCALRDALRGKATGDDAAQARHLGLWRCAQLAEGGEPRRRAEAAHLVQDQLRDMGQLAPAT